MLKIGDRVYHTKWQNEGEIVAIETDGDYTVKYDTANPGYDCVQTGQWGDFLEWLPGAPKRTTVADPPKSGRLMV